MRAVAANAAAGAAQNDRSNWTAPSAGERRKANAVSNRPPRRRLWPEQLEQERLALLVGRRQLVRNLCETIEAAAPDRPNSAAATAAAAIARRTRHAMLRNLYRFANETPAPG